MNDRYELREELELGDRLARPRGWPRVLMAIVNGKRGQLDQARGFIREIEEILAQQPHNLYLASISQAKGLLAIGEGQWEAAWDHFAEACEVLVGMGLRNWRALALREWAQAHLSRGEPEALERARQLREETRLEFEAMGSTGYVEEIQVPLTKLASLVG